MIARGYRCMLVEETFVVYLYGTDEEIDMFKSLTGDDDCNLDAVALLVNGIRRRCL